MLPIFVLHCHCWKPVQICTYHGGLPMRRGGKHCNRHSTPCRPTTGWPLRCTLTPTGPTPASVLPVTVACKRHPLRNDVRRQYSPPVPAPNSSLSCRCGGRLILALPNK